MRVNNISERKRQNKHMSKLAYWILMPLLGGLTFTTPAAAQTITGSGSVSGNLTLNATGVFFNSGGVNTAANPLTPGSSNTGSFAGLSCGAIQNVPGTLAPDQPSSRASQLSLRRPEPSSSTCRASRRAPAPARRAPAPV